jgi:hypothetical protein
MTVLFLFKIFKENRFVITIHDHLDGIHLEGCCCFFIWVGEANKQLGDYKFKLQKAEQDVSTLQASVSAI